MESVFEEGDNFIVFPGQCPEYTLDLAMYYLRHRVTFIVGALPATFLDICWNFLWRCIKVKSRHLSFLMMLPTAFRLYKVKGHILVGVFSVCAVQAKFHSLSHVKRKTLGHFYPLTLQTQCLEDTDNTFQPFLTSDLTNTVPSPRNTLIFVVVVVVPGLLLWLCTSPQVTKVYFFLLMTAIYLVSTMSFSIPITLWLAME